ncbi:AI-2E family transporter [[Pseudomonas] carboxydohydrogena]|uniref:AI-2E family transporter n=1 Tax=Afipia carboxydohydrogena TaxID=290 RepID=A0ABY8BSR2_AFICR|nr:AI-2E family transporter [[Pseudomonas] carboxydohydrogena]WEF53013.1 AI-2E family transporter [[Pseudomonas] carboxydohydrogena]
MSVSTERKNQRQDYAWAIAVGGIVAVSFAALLVFAWEFAATLFLIFSGVLLGVALTAMTNLLKKVMPGPHAGRLLVICLLLAAMMAGIFTLGGSTIAQQATALSGTIKSQIVNLKTFLESYGFDASYLDLNTISATAPRSPTTPAATPALPNVQHNLPSAGAIASGGGAIVSQTLKLILGTVGAVGNFFIVLFLGLAFAAQPGVYRKGLIAMSPRAIRPQMETVIDRIGSTLERWLIAQMITMTAVFVVTWLGLLVIGIPGAFILGVQAGLLTFIPTVGALLGGLIIVLASISSGWVAIGSAFALLLGVHALESYILTPIIQREAIDIPPATLFAFQILLGVVFGVWGLALALPVMAVVKVILVYLREDRPKTIAA